MINGRPLSFESCTPDSYDLVELGLCLRGSPELEGPIQAVYRGQPTLGGRSRRGVGKTGKVTQSQSGK